VIDTGVLVSAFAFGGTPSEVVRKAFSEAEICVSPELLKECRDVPTLLHSEGKITDRQFTALISGIAAVVAVARMVHPKKRIKVCRDPVDDMVLECCHASVADYLITGDRDLLSFQNLPFSLRILTPRGYVDLS
jgi:putative PIN family toxin of toxin-antitoxin system